MAKKRNNIIKVLLILSVIVVVINAFRAEYSPYIKQVAKMGTYIESVEADALLVRNETVVEPGTKGVMEPVVSEGERVAAYSRLGAIVTGNIDEAKMNELNTINARIEVLNQTVSEAGLLTIDDSKVDATLQLSLDNLRYSSAKDDTGSAAMLCENVRILTERKAGVTTSSSAQEELENLEAQRNRIASSLGGSHRDVYSPTAGIYSDNLDGMENVLTFKALESLTPATVDNFIKKLESSKAGGPCKVINNYKWYIVFNLTEAECEGLMVGGEYAVAFKELGEKELDGTVEYISEPDDKGMVAVTIRFDRYMDNFTTVRRTKVEICKEKYTGIYIPRNALRVEEVQGVWVQNEVALEFRSVQEVYRNDDFLLVKEDAEGLGGHKNISLYDNIVINPDK